MDKQGFIEYLKVNTGTAVRVLATGETGTVANWAGKSSLSMLIKGPSITTGVYVRPNTGKQELKWIPLTDLEPLFI